MKPLRNNSTLIASMAIGLFVLAAVFASFPILKVSANPMFFLRKQTNSATSTLAYLSQATATTTTAAFDLTTTGALGADSAVLALAFTGSTTPTNAAVATTTYNIAIEYSQDGIDWYSDGQFPATTTTAVGISGSKVHSVTLGTQTLNGTLVGSTTPTRTLFEVPTPTKYVRAVISVPLLGASGANNTNGAVWAEFVAKKQNNSN